MEDLVRIIHAVVPVVWTAAGMTYLFVILREDGDAERWAPRVAWTAALLHLAEFAAEASVGAAPLVRPGTLVSGMGLAVGSRLPRDRAADREADDRRLRDRNRGGPRDRRLGGGGAPDRPARGLPAREM